MRSRFPYLYLAAILLSFVDSQHAYVPNNLEATPLRGWRSWQAFGREVDQQIIEDSMRGLAELRGSDKQSLAQAGYTDAGLDAGYEMVGKGFGGSCHTQSGHMLINTTRFPSFATMTATAHSLGLTASWYLNNDPCKGANERKVGPTYDTDAADAVRYGFDGVKFDSQRGGPSNNITMWSMAMQEAAAAAGKTEGILVENCQDKNPTYLLRDPQDCPYNHYRSGPDNSPSFFGSLANVFTFTVPYLHVKEPVPASRPHCWAYPDMLSIGAPIKGTVGYKDAISRGCANMTLDEERTLFANWAVVSSPLVLAFDVRDEQVVRKYWPIITNQNALRVNSAWAGSPGELLRQSAQEQNRNTPVGFSCEESKFTVLPDWLVYVKPLPDGEVACLIINLGDKPLAAADNATVTLRDLVTLANSTSIPTSFSVADVWTGQVLPEVSAASSWSPVGLSGHNSSFVIFTPVSMA